MKTSSFKKLSFLIILFLILTSISFKVYKFKLNYSEVIKQADIRYTWKDSVSLAEGEKIYQRILKGDLVNNQKYPLYWPFIYQLTALFYRLGGSLFTYSLLTLIVSLLLESLASLAIFKFFANQKKEFAGLFFSFFWLFNNYNFFVSGTLQLDIVIASLLIICLLVLEKNTFFSAFAYGLSLSIKQFGVLVFPVYLFLKKQGLRKKKYLKTLGLIFLLPLLSALPIVIGQPKGFLISMIFSLVRRADRPGGYALGFFGEYGLFSRLPFLIAYFWLVLLLKQEKFNRFSFVFLIYLMIIFFNPVLFPQYFVYLVPFSGCQLFLKKDKR